MPGPKGLLQEKYQRTSTDPKTDGENEWANLNGFHDNFKLRKVYEHTYETYNNDIHARDSGFTDPDLMVSVRLPKTNLMPPGMFIDNNEPMVTEQPYKYVPAGESDVSNRVSPKMMRDGFLPNQMSPVDDMYNNEHVEEFYGEAKGEDDANNKITGFLERNNYLDRS